MSDTLRQIEVIKKILQASDSEVERISFWMNIVKEYGIYPFQWLVELDEAGIYTTNGMMQVQGEIASFCRFLSNQEIHTAMEIGVWRGRSSYFICATLYRKNRDLIYNMVDIVDGLDEYEEFQKVLPCLRKQIPHTSDDFVGQEYDFVFIDADHSYEASMKDYTNVGCFAKKLVCFHDIYAHEYDAEGGGSVKTWEEVCTMTPQMPKVVFSQFPNRWMGIGVVVNTVSEKPTIGTKDDYEKLCAEKNEFLEKVKAYNQIWIYGARNDSRRMYRALLSEKLPVLGLIVHDETENPEKLPDYPVSHLDEVELGDDTIIVVCFREALRESAMRYLRELDGMEKNIVIVSDMLATFLK